MALLLQRNKAIAWALAVYVVGGVLAAMVPDVGGTIQAFATVILVAVTTFYAVKSADMAAQTERLADETKRLADGSRAQQDQVEVLIGETHGLAQAAREQAVATQELVRENQQLVAATQSQAQAAQEGLLHWQQPVLVLAVWDQPAPGWLRLRLQNVGEGAAIWPTLKWQEGGPPNLLDVKLDYPDSFAVGTNAALAEAWGPPPFVLAPRQFAPEDGVLRRLPEPEEDGGILSVDYVDPRRPGETIRPETWRLFRPDGKGGKWYVARYRA